MMVMIDFPDLVVDICIFIIVIMIVIVMSKYFVTQIF